MKMGRWLLALLLATAAAPRGPARDEGGAPPQQPRHVALEEVFDDPVAWLGLEARGTFQLQELPPSWNPYLTRFGTGDWVAARIWSDGQFLWRQEEFEHPLGLIFARADTPAALALAEARPYDRFEVRLRVDQVFRGLPWAEVVELVPLPRKVDEGSILHASRALHLMAGASWKLAISDLARATVPSLPVHALDELHRLRSECEAQMFAARRSRRLNEQVGGLFVRK